MAHPAPQLSRRLAGGAYTGKGPKLGARAIFVYAQLELRQALNELQPIFEIIFSIHGESGVRYWLGCFSLGCEHHELHAERISEPSEILAADTFVRASAQLSKTQIGLIPAFLPALSSPAWKQLGVSEEGG